MADFYLIWEEDTLVLRTYDDTNQVWQDGSLSFPVAFPGTTTDVQSIGLYTSAKHTLTLDVLTQAKLYLTGADVSLVQEQWPYLGNATTPARPELNGGFEVSFDNGRTFIRFDKQHGYAKDPSTWILIPSTAIGLDALDGQLGPYDIAHLLVRLVVPPQSTDYKSLDLRLAVDCDIL